MQTREDARAKARVEPLRRSTSSLVEDAEVSLRARLGNCRSLVAREAGTTHLCQLSVPPVCFALMESNRRALFRRVPTTLRTFPFWCRLELTGWIYGALCGPAHFAQSGRPGLHDPPATRLAASGNEWCAPAPEMPLTHKAVRNGALRGPHKY